MSLSSGHLTPATFTVIRSTSVMEISPGSNVPERGEVVVLSLSRAEVADQPLLFSWLSPLPFAGLSLFFKVEGVLAHLELLLMLFSEVLLYWNLISISYLPICVMKLCLIPVSALRSFPEKFPGVSSISGDGNVHIDGQQTGRVFLGIGKAADVVGKVETIQLGFAPASA